MEHVVATKYKSQDQGMFPRTGGDYEPAGLWHLKDADTSTFPSVSILMLRARPSFKKQRALGKIFFALS